MKLIYLLLLSSVSFSSQATQTNAKEIIAPVYNMFDAMRAHDKEKFLLQFTDNAILERVTKENQIKVSNIDKFAEFIDKSPKYLDEKLLSVSSHVSDNLASVWTVYAFYLDGKLSHCGVNSFQLIKQQTQWKIKYLIDNTHPDDCQVFMKKYKQETLVTN